MIPTRAATVTLLAALPRWSAGNTLIAARARVLVAHRPALTHAT